MTSYLRVLTVVSLGAWLGPVLRAAPPQPAPAGASHAAEPSGANAIAATVGPSTVSAAALSEAIAVARRRAIAEHRLDAFTSDTADRLLDDLIDATLFSLAARDRGLDRRPEVARRIEAAVNQVLAQATLTDDVTRLALTDESIASYFETHRDRFRGPPRIHARHIVVRTREEALAAAEALGSGAEFEAIARERNVDSTKSAGGDLGWVTKGTMVAPFDAALFALKRGEASEVVATGVGFHIVRAEEIEPGNVPALSAIAEQVRVRIVEERVSALRRQLLEQYLVTRHRDVIESLRK